MTSMPLTQLGSGGPASATAIGVPALARALFTAEEVAAALAVSETLVRQLTLCGDLPCRRIGRLVRYTAADIEAFVHSFDARGYLDRTS